MSKTKKVAAKALKTVKAPTVKHGDKAKPQPTTKRGDKAKGTPKKAATGTMAQVDRSAAAKRAWITIRANRAAAAATAKAAEDAAAAQVAELAAREAKLLKALEAATSKGKGKAAKGRKAA